MSKDLAVAYVKKNPACSRFNGEGHPRICVVCGKPFFPNAGRQITCSSACSKKNKKADKYAAYYGVTKKDALQYLNNR